MKRQRVQRDSATGVVIHYYVDLGPGRARFRTARDRIQLGGTKNPPPLEGWPEAMRTRRR